jgi:hypothetical protein
VDAPSLGELPGEGSPSGVASEPDPSLAVAVGDGADGEGLGVSVGEEVVVGVLAGVGVTSCVGPPDDPSFVPSTVRPTVVPPAAPSSERPATASKPVIPTAAMAKTVTAPTRTRRATRAVSGGAGRSPRTVRSTDETRWLVCFKEFV